MLSSCRSFWLAQWPFPTRIAFQRWLALAVLLMLLGAAIAERGEPASNTLFLLLPIVVFTALVAGVAGAAAAGSILLFILLGIGGMQHLSQAEAIIRVVFIGTATATGYILAVIWREREHGATRLFHLAHHDSLTGMYNRHALETRLQKAVWPTSSAHALLYLDSISSSSSTIPAATWPRGPDAAGALARAAARAAARGHVRGLGGDEFACILLHATEGALRSRGLAPRRHRRYRFLFSSMSFAVGVSIGITSFPPRRYTADSVLGAPTCLLRGQGRRPNRSHVYFPATSDAEVALLDP